MVFLDVVYNHFGPEGNYLPRYAPQFFTDRHQTPWGAAIDFERSRRCASSSSTTRSTGCEEYRFDGLRFDAVHAISTTTPTSTSWSRSPRRSARAFPTATSTWSSRTTATHASCTSARAGRRAAPTPRNGTTTSTTRSTSLATGETDGYYAAYAERPLEHLARCLAEGFAYQGESRPSRRRRAASRAAHLPPAAFVDFLQNHDQIGNRAFGERLTVARAEPTAARR